jgi:hypothetical protein
MDVRSNGFLLNRGADRTLSVHFSRLGRGRLLCEDPCTELVSDGLLLSVAVRITAYATLIIGITGRRASGSNNIAHVTV